MFTGIVEELGALQEIRKPEPHSALLIVKASKVLEGLQLGDSIAVNGVCLTVVSFERQTFTADVMAETLAKTNLGSLTRGSKVNLERALTLNTRLGGHLVSGHVDGVGEISRKFSHGIANVLEISASKEICNAVVPKGSIAIDGISLTVVTVSDSVITVSLIPHTFKETTLGLKGPGDKVNLENDMLGKYVQHFMTARSNSKSNSIGYDFLAENGFV